MNTITRRLLKIVISFMMIVAVVPSFVFGEDVSTLTELGGSLASGTYKLTNDIKLTTDITVSTGNTVTIDLNGHTLTGTGSSSVITVNGTLTIQDSSDSGDGKITGGIGTYKKKNVYKSKGYYGGGILVDTGTLNLLSGTISGNTLTNYKNGDTTSSTTDEDTIDYGAGIYVYKGTFNMSGGTISNNTANNGFGGGVSTYGSVFKMTGGTITNNTVTGQSIDLETDSTYSIYGYNEMSATNGFGGGIYVSNTSVSEVTLSGGIITSNTALIGGGLAFGDSSKVTLSGSLVIANNTADVAGADIVSDNNCTLNISDDVNSETFYTDKSNDKILIDGWYTDLTSGKLFYSKTRYSNESTHTEYTNFGSTNSSIIGIIAAGEKTYKVTYSDGVEDSSDGDIFTDETFYTSGKVASFSGSTDRTGYTFKGWTTDSSVTDSSTIITDFTDVTISENKTYYAVWTKNTYALNVDDIDSLTISSDDEGNETLSYLGTVYDTDLGKTFEIPVYVNGEEATSDVIKSVSTDSSNITVSKDDDGTGITLTLSGSLSSGDYSETFTVTYEDDSTETITVTFTVDCVHDYVSEVTTAATCTEDGVMTYTCTKCGDTYTESISALGHDYDYDDIEWTWSDDYSSATATVTCSKDSSHTETIEATVTSETVSPTFTSEGKTVYTATITVDGEEYTDTVTIAIDKLTLSVVESQSANVTITTDESGTMILSITSAVTSDDTQKIILSLDGNIELSDDSVTIETEYGYVTVEIDEDGNLVITPDIDALNGSGTYTDTITITVISSDGTAQDIIVTFTYDADTGEITDETADTGDGDNSNDTDISDDDIETEVMQDEEDGSTNTATSTSSDAEETADADTSDSTVMYIYALTGLVAACGVCYMVRRRKES